MKHTAGNPDELKTKFWKALADSPFLFLQLDGHSATAVPMSPQLDKDANSSIWFFTHTKSDFAKLGRATATKVETSTTTRAQNYKHNQCNA